jgi:hypothetical protein
MGFWDAIFGKNPNLSTDIGTTQQAGGFGIGTGESNVNAGSDFMKAILSGDSSKTTQDLAPEISSAKTSAAQTNKTNALFGNRSGGTAASAASTDDKVHSDITNLIGSLTGNAANSLVSSGTSLLGTGTAATAESAGLSQEQMQNWQQGLFGGIVSGGAGIGLGALAKKLGLAVG